MQIHPQFKLNDIALNRDSLYEVAYSWVKEGRDFEIQAGDFLLDWLSPSSTILVRTSGSTGIPKTIGLEKEFMVNSALATGKFFRLSPGNKALLCLSSEYIAGKMMLVRAMVLGLELDVVAPSSNPMVGLEKDYDFGAMVPLQAQNTLSELDRVKTLLVGGAPMTNELRQALSMKRNAIYSTYGMTETITHIAAKKVSGVQKSDTEGSFELLPEVSISKDERGCLVIDAPKVAKEAVLTNDLVELVDDTHFKWLGRYDNIINSGGVKLIPEQIEGKLSKIISNRFFVIGIPDNKLGEKMVLLIEGQIHNKEDLHQKIKALKTLSKFEIPKKLFFVNQFLETPTGKIQRKKTLSSFLTR